MGRRRTFVIALAGLVAMLAGALPAVSAAPASAATMPQPVQLTGTWLIYSGVGSETGYEAPASLTGTIDGNGVMQFSSVQLDPITYPEVSPFGGTVDLTVKNDPTEAPFFTPTASGSYVAKNGRGAIDVTVRPTVDISSLVGTARCTATTPLTFPFVPYDFAPPISGAYDLFLRGTTGAAWSGNALCSNLPSSFAIYLQVSFASKPVSVPEVNVGDVRIMEGHSKSRNALVPVTLSQPDPVNPTTVDVAVAGATATPGKPTIPGSDFKGPFTKRLTFKPGTVVQYVSVPVYGDLDSEGDEEFTVALSNPSAGYAIGADVVGIGTIIDDEFPGIVGVNQLAIDDVVTWEGDAGARTVKFTVSLAQPANQPVTFQYGIVPGSATGGYAKGPVPAGTEVRDFLGALKTVTFKPSSTTGLTAVQKTIAVTVYPDLTTEDPNVAEDFAVVISGVNGPVLVTRDVGVGYLVDDD